MPLNIDWQQILLHLFNLVLLAGGLYFLLYSPIKKFVTKREEYYKLLNDEAMSKLESAKSFEAKANERFENVDAEIAEKRNEAEAEIEEYKEQKIKEAKKAADEIVAEARDIANAEKQAILDSADREIIDIAKAAAAKMLCESTNAAYEQFLSIAERNSTNE